MILLTTPIQTEAVRKLKVFDTFSITGTVFTARDAAHEKLLDLYKNGSNPPFSVGDLPCFHCGPVMRNNDGVWEVVSAGPTTSSRMDLFEDQFMDAFGTRVFIGKGGMGHRTSAALQKHGGIYAQFTGGAGSLMAGAVKRVESVYYLDELGIPEAIWLLNVVEFGPLLVTMDSFGQSIHQTLAEKVSINLDRIKKSL
ncbi:fumarate hydratase C-terminal domain-containing protein [bacterium]|nr:fumarate hydratase C-terminal domain-containing protein [candidate division CSSED10-310 bacterium]